MTTVVKTGERGLLVDQGSPVGGFFGWRITTVLDDFPVSRDGKSGRMYTKAKKTFLIDKWFLNKHADSCLAIFCTLRGSKMVPMQSAKFIVPVGSPLNKFNEKHEFEEEV